MLSDAASDDTALLESILAGHSGPGRVVQPRVRLLAWLRALVLSARAWRVTVRGGIVAANAALVHGHTGRALDPIDYSSVRRLATVIRVFLRLLAGWTPYYRKGVACLPESVGICVGLRSLGVADVVVVIGMSDWVSWSAGTKNPAHAWVEHRGEQVSELTEVVPSYRVIDRLPRQQREASTGLRSQAR